MNKNITTKSLITIIAVGVLLTVGVTCMSVGFAIMNKKNYQYARNNPPETELIEKDLEPIFLTTDIVVYEENIMDNHAYYTVYANKLYYKVEYAIKKYNWFNYYWQYQKYVQAGGYNYE